MQDEEQVCRQIYAKTKLLYEQDLKTCCPYGFKILYGPPLLRPEILFVGYQPGGGAHDDQRERLQGAHDAWPGVCEYATAPWPLAVNMRQMFGVERVKRCVALNAIFFRFPDVDAYRKMVPVAKRRQIEQYCTGQVERIVVALNPTKIIAIGFEALRLFGPTRADVVSTKGRALTISGSIANRSVLGVLHLSGARISTLDRLAIAARILNN